jgi:hypothetical protein
MYVNGKKHGPGILTKDGDYILCEGEWDNDQFVDGNINNPLGKTYPAPEFSEQGKKLGLSLEGKIVEKKISKYGELYIGELKDYK